MDQDRSSEGAAGTVDYVARARDLIPMIAAASDQTERERMVPEEVMTALKQAGLFHMLVPRSVGGGESDPLSYMQVLEAVASADASTAWCLGQGVGCTIAAGFMEPEAARDVFSQPDGILAWGPTGANAKAVKVDGGYRVSGRWRFASGSPRATWLGGHSVVYEDDDTPAKDAKGRPVMRTMLFPVTSATVHDVWHVIGLRGTGSDDYEVKDLFVPDSYTTWRGDVPREPGPLWRIPLLTHYGMGFAGISLGIARATIEEFKKLAMTKVGAGSTKPLCENAVIQSGLAQAEGKLCSARSYLMQMIGETWDTACRGADFPLEQRARLRISITWASNQAKEAVDFAYTASGTNAIFESGPFERRFRDMHTVTQQGQSHLSNFEFAGRALFGMDPGHRV